MAKIDILLKALGTIADYDYSSDRDGICPYGCDTPFIARLALKKYAEETDAPDKEKVCPRCNGYGYDRRKRNCLNCGGTGYVKKAGGAPDKEGL